MHQSMSNPQSRCIIRGSINNDEYFYVKTIARPGETISSYRYEQRVGGKGANQAVAITRAGGVADFYGTIGKDGLWVKETVGKLGLDDTHIIVSDVPIGRALIQISDSGENSIILFPGANHSKLHEEKWTSGDPPYKSPDCTHLLLQNEIDFESTLYALNNSPGATTIFNPSPLPAAEEIKKFPWNKVDWLIVNEGEAEDLYQTLRELDSPSPPKQSDPTSHRELLAALSGQPAFSDKTNIICTLGKDGVIAYIPTFQTPHEDPLFMYLPAAALEGNIRDTTGAGDCFTGYFVAGLMEFGPHATLGREIREKDVDGILKRCVQAAGMCVERPGTIDSIPFRPEVEARMLSSSSKGN